jgi:ribosome-binding factor A
MSSQRVAKVESLVQQAVAAELAKILERDGAAVTVTRVDAAPDLRNATVWIGILGNAREQDRLWARIEGVLGVMQAAVGAKFRMKYAPRLTVKRDTGGAYAAEIDRLLRGL